VNVREHDNTAALEAIDQVGRDNPFCAACGSPNLPVARDGAIWFQCSSLDDRKTLLRRVVTLDFGHTRQIIVEASAAA